MISSIKNIIVDKRIFEKLLIIGFFLLGASLIWRKGNLADSIFHKIFELNLLLVLLLVFFDKGWKYLWKRFLLVMKDYGGLIILLLFCILIGQIWGMVSNQGLKFTDNQVILQYGSFLLSIFTFFATAVLIFYGYNKYFKYTILGIIASPIIFLPAWFGWKELYYPTGRLIGSYSDPNYFALWLLVVFFVNLVFTLQIKDKNKRFLLFLWSAFILALIFWTGSRGAWLGLFLASCVFIFWRYKNNHSINNAFKLGAILFILIILGFLILPTPAKTLVVCKILGINYQNIQVSGIFNFIPKINPSEHSGLLVKQWRHLLFIQGTHMILNNPLGLGFNYWKNIQLITPMGNSQVVHNSFLEAGLIGGLGAFIIFIAFVIRIINKCWKLFKQPFYKSKSFSIAIVSALFAAFFLDCLIFRNLWFLFGIIAGLSLKNDQSNNKDL